IPHDLGHKNMQYTVRDTALNAQRFPAFWPDAAPSQALAAPAPPPGAPAGRQGAPLHPLCPRACYGTHSQQRAPRPASAVAGPAASAGPPGGPHLRGPGPALDSVRGRYPRGAAVSWRGQAPPLRLAPVRAPDLWTLCATAGGGPGPSPDRSGAPA